MDHSTASSKLGPVQALRIIRKIIADRTLPGPAQKLVVVALVLRADNATGLAWGGYDSLHEEFRWSAKTISRALLAADGRYLELAARGRHGAKRYRILPGHKFPQEKAGDGQNFPKEIVAGRQDSPCASQLFPPVHLDLPEERQTNPVPNQSSNSKKGRHGKASPPDPRVRQFLDWFCAEFQKVRKQPYVVAHGKDGRLVKWLLKVLGGKAADPMPELRATTRAMLADSWGRANASIGLLSGQINKWRGQAAQARRRSQGDDDYYAQGF